MAASAPVRAEQKILVKTLPNGLLWIHRPVTHNKIVAFRLFFPGGSLDEPAEKAGLTRLMGAAMFKGTRKRSALQIAQETESLGASLDSGSQEDFWDMSAQCTADKFEPAFDIFQDVLLRPVFPPEEFDKEREALLNAIRANKEHIFNVAYERLQKEVFGAHPYGRPDEGTEASVKAITLEDLVRWHRDRINPKGAVFVTVGDLPVKKTQALLEKAFKDWTGAAGAPPAPPPIRYPAKPVEAEEPHLFEQSYFMLAYPAPGLRDRDYAAVKVLNALLGAGMSSPLFQVVREEGSLAYEVSSFYPSKKFGSAFVIYAGTDPKNLDLARDKVRSMLKDFLKAPPSAQAVEDAKRFIRGHYMMDHQTNGGIARYLGWWEILGKGYGYDAVYAKDVQAVTAADVAGLAGRLFRQPAAAVVIRSKKSG